MRSGFLIWIELRMWDPSKWFEIDKGEIYREREGERGRERERERERERDEGLMRW